MLALKNGKHHIINITLPLNMKNGAFKEFNFFVELNYLAKLHLAGQLERVCIQFCCLHPGSTLMPMQCRWR